jgi:hypothetical protein
MSRYRSFGNLDTQPVQEGDAYFKGLDLKHDRAILEQGMLAKSINKRLRTGVAETRRGTRTPADFNPPFTRPTNEPYRHVDGFGVVTRSNGEEVLLMGQHGETFVWMCRDGTTPAQIPILSGGAIDRFTVFVQAFDKILMLQGGKTPCVWDGVDPSTGFVAITKLDPSDTSTVLVQNVGDGIPFQNRVLYIWGRDHILMSDVLDYTSYDPVLADFRINAGEFDEIKALVPYSNESILVFMKHSIHRFSTFTTDPALAKQEVVSDQLGCVERGAAVQVGADVIFLSRKGFYRVNQVFENQTVAPPVPISDAISPLIEGVPWDLIEFLGFAALATVGDYLYAALSLGKSFPINVLVYNLVTSQWESVDAWVDNGFYMNFFAVTLYKGEKRLFALNAVFNHVYLMYEGLTDQTPDFESTETTTNPINDIMETRGYGANDLVEFKKFSRVTVSIRTLNPQVFIGALADGYNEESFIAMITKDPLKYYSWFYPDVQLPDQENVPFRQDYYTGSETTWVAQDMENILPGTIDTLPGVDAEELGGPSTESTERAKTRITGRWCSIRVNNFQGKCDIVGISVEAMPARTDYTVAA